MGLFVQASAEKKASPLGRFVGPLLVLPQIVDDAADLPGSEDALAAGVAQLAELVGERLAEVDPVL